MKGLREQGFDVSEERARGEWLGLLIVGLLMLVMGILAS